MIDPMVPTVLKISSGSGSLVLACLCRQQDLFSGRHGFFKTIDGLLASHEERHNHVGKYDNVPERK